MTDAGATTSSDAQLVRADTGMAWRIRESFVQYVQRTRSGRVRVDGGASVTGGGEFYFPLVGSEHGESGHLTLQFAGAVAFSAHMGMLSLTVRDPRIQFDGPVGALSVESDDQWLRLGDVTLPEPTEDRDVLMWEASEVVLSGDGPALFGGQYQAGEALAPLTFRVPAAQVSVLRQVPPSSRGHQ